MNSSMRRWSAGLGALAIAGVATLALSNSVARADASNDFELLAAASALDIHLADNSLPITQTVDASPYGSSAALSSSGVVKADAGAPYAPFAYSLTSTATGLGSGNLPSIPPLPGYVSASFPSESVDEQKTGGYELAARTGERSSIGSVRLGQIGTDNSTGFAISQATANEDGTVTAAGAAGVSAFRFGGVLDLGRVSSVLTMTKGQTGKPVISGSTDLGTVTVASNFSSGVKDDGSLVFGQPIPLTPSTISQLNAALAPSGVVLTYLPRTFTYTDGSTSTGAQPDASKTLRSVTSGALQVASVRDVATQGRVDVVSTFGRVMLSATNGAGGALGGDVVDRAVGAISPELENAINDASGQVDSAVGGIPPASGVLPGTTPEAVADSSVPTVDFVPTSPSGLISLAGRATTDGASVYLMLVVAAIGALGAAQLVRFFAVK